MESAPPDAQALQAAMELWAGIVMPNFLGLVLSYLFQGIFLLSVFLYYSVYPNDYVGNKLVVAVLLLLTLADTMSHTSALARQVILRPLDIEFLLSTTDNPGIYLAPLFAVLTAALSQAFMTWKVIRFARTMRGTWGASTSTITKNTSSSPWAFSRFGTWSRGWGKSSGDPTHHDRPSNGGLDLSRGIFWTMVAGLSVLWMAAMTSGLYEISVLARTSSL